MTKKEASEYLVKLYSDYEYQAIKLIYPINNNYAKAVAIAIMALAQMEDTK